MGIFFISFKYIGIFKRILKDNLHLCYNLIMFMIILCFLISTFIRGEELFFNVKLYGINIGSQKIYQGENHHEIIIISQTKTNKFFSKFYKLDDYIETHIDKKNLLPTKIFEKIDEKGSKKEILTDINQEELRARVKENNKEEEIILKGKVFNIPSLIYYLRNTDLKAIKKSFSLITQGKVEDIEIRIKDFENITIGDKIYEARMVSSNGFSIYFTKDNLPILIKTHLKDGLTLYGYLMK